MNEDKASYMKCSLWHLNVSKDALAEIELKNYNWILFGVGKNDWRIMYKNEYYQVRLKMYVRRITWIQIEFKMLRYNNCKYFYKELDYYLYTNKNERINQID